MIVMKFGGTSVAEAERIVRVAEIVRDRLDRKPVVVVSALGGVTDLLVQAIEASRVGDRERLEPTLADLERRHRWAASGAVERNDVRHDLNLALDAVFEDLRQLLRSIRILGEVTPRAADTLLAFGERLSSRIVAAAFAERGVPAAKLDAREVMLTDDSHGAAEPDLPGIRARCDELLRPLVDAGRVPVLGGFIGSTPSGETTTLGRGGGDTSAAVFGCAMGAEEIQIWTDVDGLMTADPKLVGGARLLRRVSFAEAAELAFYGAKVLHPATIAPAVQQQIPVWVLNAMQPDRTGTEILGEPASDAPKLAAVASRRGVCTVRVASKRMRIDPGFLPRVLDAFDRRGLVPDFVVSSEVAVTLVLPERDQIEQAARDLGGEVEVHVGRDRAILCIVGAGLAADTEVRGRVLSALAKVEPELVGLGGSASSVGAVFPASGLETAVKRLHREFFEEETE